MPRPAFVDGILAGETPDLSPLKGIEALQLAFAVYQASNERRAVDPSEIDESVTPTGWPPNAEKMRHDVDELFRREAARSERLGGTIGEYLGDQPKLRSSTPRSELAAGRY